MNFLVDAQLPRSLAALLQSCGHNAIHTLELPEGNRTSDDILCMLAANEQRVMVTKWRFCGFIFAAQPASEALVNCNRKYFKQRYANAF